MKRCQAAQEEEEDSTRARLQQYREAEGIDVRSEKEHASEIDEALRIAVCAMQRGRYATVVSALEKVTKYCSTNSNVDGKVLRAFSFPWAVACESVCMSEPMLLDETASRCRCLEWNVRSAVPQGRTSKEWDVTHARTLSLENSRVCPSKLMRRVPTRG